MAEKRKLFVVFFKHPTGRSSSLLILAECREISSLSMLITLCLKKKIYSRLLRFPINSFVSHYVSSC